MTMTVFEAISARYSVRRYLLQAPEPEKVERILEAARLAPSAGNRQEWRFVVVSDHARRQKLMDAAGGQAFVGQAPIVIAACAVTDGSVMRCGQLRYPIDVAIALEHIALQAVEEGLGTCWVGAFDEAAVKQAIGIPADEEIRVVQLMSLGYPADEPKPKSRLPLSTIVMHDTWRG
jgi:nitroreductase